MFETVLIANRGEIARRIIRTLRAHNIRSVAIYSEGDATAPHVREADVAVCVGPDPAHTSYLNIDAVVQSALDTGAQAIHPGYGFLAENVAFARACETAGVVFIGPGAHAIDIMGDKARSRDHVSEHGVPVVPGFSAAGLSEDEIAREAEKIGYPILVKPSAGGGGKGMEVVSGPAGLADALAAARRIATAAFGDDSMVLERLIERPRHIEVQVLGCADGSVISLGERECTLQRRHQKVMEEAPSAGGISTETRARLFVAAINAAKSVNYVGAGTVEFLVDADNTTDFFFIEMNTRLQVEHPVTEAVTGVDLVHLQLLVAAGEPVAGTAISEGSLEDVYDPQATSAVPVGLSARLTGHSVEARVYAESPERGFLPSAGDVLLFDAPEKARVDAAVETGDEVSGLYDPMIAKVITFAQDRKTALEQLDAALAHTTVLGVDTNIAMLRQLCQHDRVRQGDIDTGLIDTMLPFDVLQPTTRAIAAAALAVTQEQKPARSHASDLWTSTTAWRMGADETFTPETWFVTDHDELVSGVPAVEATVNTQGAARQHDTELGAVHAAVDAEGAVWVADAGASWRLRPISRRQRTLRSLGVASGVKVAQGPECASPMPGAVVAVHVTDGAIVEAGEPLVSIEAMKMEHPVVSPHPGRVHLMVAIGDQVRRDEIVARVEAAEKGTQ